MVKARAPAGLIFSKYLEVCVWWTFNQRQERYLVLSVVHVPWTGGLVDLRPDKTREPSIEIPKSWRSQCSSREASSKRSESKSKSKSNWKMGPLTSSEPSLQCNASDTPKAMYFPGHIVNAVEVPPSHSHPRVSSSVGKLKEEGRS